MPGGLAYRKHARGRIPVSAPHANPTPPHGASRHEAKSLDSEGHEKRAAASRPGHRGRGGRFAQSLVQAAIATLLLAMLLSSILWLRSSPTQGTSQGSSQ